MELLIQQTTVFGFPVPSDSKVFLAFIVFHIILGLTCALSGIVAMLSKKGQKTHIRAGKIYFIGMSTLFITIVVTSLQRWPYDIHLLIVGSAAYAFAFTGRQLAHNPKPGWTRLHTICMGLSFVLLVTGFYVDNGKNLPFWNQFPQLFFWIFPSAIGVPIILYVFFRHPMNRQHKGK
jgi:hypothetical protein